MSRWQRNARYAIRQLIRSPIFTVTVVLTLGFGIGGVTSIFTLIDATMLRSLPVSDPARLYRIGEGDECCGDGGPQDRWGLFPYSFFERITAAAPEFEQITAFQAGTDRSSVRREYFESVSRPLRTEFVAGNYFLTLGVGAFSGRVFSPGDDTPDASPVAVLSHHAWQMFYGGDPAAVGSTFVVDGHPFTVVGVAAAGFFGETLRSDPPDMWLPLQQEPALKGPSSHLHSTFLAWLRIMGRLRPRATIVGVAPRLTTLLRQWMLHEANYPPNLLVDVVRLLPRQVINIVPAGGGVGLMKEEYGRSLQILLAVCGLVLLIACANVANLLFARSAARCSQTALRLAVGATQQQIISLALCESVVLAIIGGAAGVLLSIAATRLLLALAFHSTGLPSISIAPSPLVLTVAFGLAVLTGIIFGVGPAWFSAHISPAEILRSSNRRASDPSSSTRQLLLVAQVTISVLLMAGSTMLTHSLNNLEHQRFGYPIQGRVLVALDRPPFTYSRLQLAELYRELQTRLNSLPGVRSANLTQLNPLTGNWTELIMVQGHAPSRFTEEGGASVDRVDASYLQNLGIDLVRGRYFTDADNEGAAPVAIVNEGFVRRFFKNNEDPLEHHFGLDLPELADTFRIIGIVRDAKFTAEQLTTSSSAMAFVPLAQHVNYADELLRHLEAQSHLASGILIVTNVSPAALEPLLNRTLAEVDPNLSISSVRTLQQQVDLLFDRQRAVASLSALFGIVSLLLAAVGLYGITSYMVTQRTNEIGVRIALGASRSDVITLVLRGAFLRVLLGLALGLPLAMAAGRLISSQLYGVSSADPVAMATASIALGISAFIATLIPAKRAASMPAIEALRN